MKPSLVGALGAAFGIEGIEGKENPDFLGAASLSGASFFGTFVPKLPNFMVVERLSTRRRWIRREQENGSKYFVPLRTLKRSKLR